jgi:tetratricopeptide (TPR) repeat protein
VLVEIGTVHLMARDEGRAREAFEAALVLNPGVARAHSSLGFMAAESGRREEALEHLRAAVRLDPREHEKLLALGVLLWRRSGSAAARPFLELFVASAPEVLYAREIERVRSRLAANGAPASP